MSTEKMLLQQHGAEPLEAALLRIAHGRPRAAGRPGSGRRFPARGQGSLAAHRRGPATPSGSSQQVHIGSHRPFLSVLSREPGAQHPGCSARAALPGGIETRAVRPRPPGGRTHRVRAVLREAVPESCGVSGASEHEVPSPEGGPLGPPAPCVRLGMGDGCSRGRPGLRASAREGGGHRAG